MTEIPNADLHPIQLVVGLGNPGTRYAKTRHNAGFWFVEGLLEQHHQAFPDKEQFKSLFLRFNHEGVPRFALCPHSFMNNSGQAVAQCINFYKIPLEAVLIVYDELEFAPGVVRFKQGGGHGGHNGMRDILQHLPADHFHRLRIGIGHPGHKDKVSDYVLTKPSSADRQEIDLAIDEALSEMSSVWAGDIAAAMRALHQPNEPDQAEQ